MKLVIAFLLAAAVHEIQAYYGGRSTTYVHWGKSACTGGSKLVYSGFAGGNYFRRDHKNMGGPANTLCLSANPQHVRAVPDREYSNIYGAEYLDDRFSTSNLNYDVPCAVCQTKRQANAIMIPGRVTCYGNWKLKYTGYIMAGNWDHTASEYICVDKDAERSGKKKAMYGRNLFLVETKCGSLPCPPYKDNQVLPCVVCAQ